MHKTPIFVRPRDVDLDQSRGTMLASGICPADRRAMQINAR
jgi:hypothetical protein